VSDWRDFLQSLTLLDRLNLAQRLTSHRFTFNRRVRRVGCCDIGHTTPIRSARDKTFCEFFAGIGLVREGLESSGWSCVYANDIDAKKRQAYEARFGP